MEIKIRYGSDMSEAEFCSLLELDKKSYGPEIITNEGMALQRFLKNKECVIAAYQAERLAGFICFLSVGKDVYERALFNKEYFDDNLSADNVCKFSLNSENYILLIDIVVDNEFQNLGLSRLLLEKTGQFLNNKDKEGFRIEQIFAYAVSEDGLKAAKACGGTVIWHRDNIHMFTVNKKRFMEQI